MIPLIIGTALAVVALCFVLWPLLVPPTARMASSSAFRSSPDYAVDALRELEFDRATGKISDADYSSLKATYTRKALTMMRAGDRFVCEKCGPRPETDAVFCSSCGASLAA
jgi:cytochrome c-type biogenesis protein CcmI